MGEMISLSRHGYAIINRGDILTFDPIDAKMVKASLDEVANPESSFTIHSVSQIFVCLFVG